MTAMLRALAPFLIVALIISGAGGIAYASGAIGVLATYGVMLLAGLVVGVPYLRWEDRHHADRKS